MKKIILLFVIILLSCAFAQAQKSPYVRWPNGTPAVSDQQIVAWTKQALSGVAPTGAVMTADASDYINVLTPNVYNQALTGPLVVTTANGTETNWGIDPNGIPVKAGVLAKGTKVISLPNGVPVAKWGTNGCLNATSDDQDDPDVAIQQPKPQPAQQPNVYQPVLQYPVQQQPIIVNCCPQQPAPAPVQSVNVNCCPQPQPVVQQTYTVPVVQPQPVPATQTVYTQPVLQQPCGCVQGQTHVCKKANRGLWAGLGFVAGAVVGAVIQNNWPAVRNATVPVITQGPLILPTGRVTQAPNYQKP